MGFPRHEYWSGLPFHPPGDLPDPGIKPASPVSLALAGRFFATEPPGKPKHITWIPLNTFNHLLASCPLWKQPETHSFGPQPFYKSTKTATLDGTGRMQSAQTSQSFQEDPLHKSVPDRLPEEPFQSHHHCWGPQDAALRCSGTGPPTDPHGPCVLFSRGLYTVASQVTQATEWIGCRTFFKPFESKTKHNNKKDTPLWVKLLSSFHLIR